MEERNRAFWQMHAAACRMLSEKNPKQIAEHAGVDFDGSSFRVSSLGKVYRFSYPDYLCRDSLDPWYWLVILHYFHMADDTPVSGNPISLAQMPSGMVRGGGYDRSVANSLTQFLHGKTQQEIRAAFVALGGREIPGKADYSVELPFLPRVPLYVNIWFADEEFPPSGRLLVDSTAGHYLTIEDAVSVAEIFLGAIGQASSNEIACP